MSIQPKRVRWSDDIAEVANDIARTARRRNTDQMA